MAGTIRDICREEWKRFVENADIDPEFKRALKVHERVPVFIDNLCRELMTVKNVTKDDIIKAVRDMSGWFLTNAQRKAGEQMMSDATKSMMLKKQAEKEQFDKDVETIDKKGVMHVLENSEALEEERSKVGIKASEYKRAREESGAGSEPTP
jgi:membrane-associated HD superfamily phosphohydrolase